MLHNKIIILFIALHLNSMLFGMEVEQKHSLIQLLQPIDKHITENIMNLTTLRPKQWWYLYTTKQINSPIICFDPSETFLITMNNYKEKIRMFNIKTRQEINLYPHATSYYVASFSSASFDSSGKFLAKTVDKNTDIFDLQTLQKINCFSHEIPCICFESSEKYFATTPESSNLQEIHILAQYNNYTLEQLLLKKALLTWLLIEKPNKKIITVEALLEDVALKCAISYDLLEILSTFPKSMQDALMETMGSRIQKYGKENNENCTIQ